MCAMQQSYVPILYEDLMNQSGPIGRLAKPRAARRGRHQRPFAPTSPRPMAFELRAQSRPKTIMQAGLVSTTPCVVKNHVIQYRHTHCRPLTVDSGVLAALYASTIRLQQMSGPMWQNLHAAEATLGWWVSKQSCCPCKTSN